MDLSLFGIFFTKFYFLRISGLQVTDIQKKRCRVYLEVITSTPSNFVEVCALRCCFRETCSVFSL